MGLDLITLDEYKVIEGIQSSAQDDKLEAILTSVSQLVKTYCGTDFVDNIGSPGVTDIFDLQWQSNFVQLSRAPVIQILSVSERPNQLEAYTELYGGGSGSPAGYAWYHDSISDSIYRTNETGAYSYWPCGVGSVRVTYTAGFLQLPEDLKLAVVDLITYYSKDEYKSRQSIGSSTRNGVPTSTAYNDTGFPDHIKRVLDLYRGL